ncbi:unnamed protein product [Diplocarpon coronariae]
MRPGRQLARMDTHPHHQSHSARDPSWFGRILARVELRHCALRTATHTLELPILREEATHPGSDPEVVLIPARPKLWLYSTLLHSNVSPETLDSGLGLILAAGRTLSAHELFDVSSRRIDSGCGFLPLAIVAAGVAAAAEVSALTLGSPVG